VVVSGAEAVVSGSMGTYTKVAGLTQGSRPVYQRVGSAVRFLFYWTSTRNWYIGGNYSSSSSNVKSTGTNAPRCPDQATGWQAYTGGAWVSTYPITVAPAAGQLPTAAPTAIEATSAPTDVTDPVSDVPTTAPIVASPAPASTNPAASDALTTAPDAPTSAPTAAAMAVPALEPTATSGARCSHFARGTVPSMYMHSDTRTHGSRQSTCTSPHPPEVGARCSE
jgi:hypothetical protein